MLMTQFQMSMFEWNTKQYKQDSEEPNVLNQNSILHFIIPFIVTLFHLFHQCCTSYSALTHRSRVLHSIYKDLFQEDSQ